MKEFGSDFHYTDPGNNPSDTITELHPSADFFADGRQALVHLSRFQGWKRLWAPEYFCYDVLESLKNLGLTLAFYEDYPGCDDNRAISLIPFEKGDALFRVNYFGTRSFRSPSIVPQYVPVVEDHTHDLLGDWAKSSEADWCISSLRKTLPVPEGGMLWSPKGLTLPKEPSEDEENGMVARKRWKAMFLKRDYLSGKDIDKEEFRKLLLETEPYFDRAEVSSLDTLTKEYLSKFNLLDWYSRKSLNWEELHSLESDHFKILEVESPGCFPFSMTIVCESKEYRDSLRAGLISKRIYPAILWNIPDEESVSSASRELSQRMLSIHCDGRYSISDIKEMKSIIMSII